MVYVRHKLDYNLTSTKAVVRDKKAGNAYSAAGDDDINDVAAMGGVNLAEEANRILGATDNVGTVVRSCKDETFLQTGLLHQRITRICKEKVGDIMILEVVLCRATFFGNSVQVGTG